MNKLQLRSELKSRLVSLSPEERAEKSKRACQNLIETPEFQQAAVIMIYLSLPHEVDTANAILYAWQQHKTVAVPKVSWQQRHMIPVVLTSLETGFSTEVSGLRNPVTGVPIPIEEIDLVVTPGLGFDRSGNRLGRGGSYYDRFFANKDMLAVKCGFAFGTQIIENVPVAEHDIQMDMIVSEEAVVYCPKKITQKNLSDTE